MMTDSFKFKQCPKMCIISRYFEACKVIEILNMQAFAIDSFHCEIYKQRNTQKH